jgi:prepilin-type N-terminal cleavage/methylation domain-containing protein
MKPNQSGFTLIELVMVIIILGILAATAIPRFLDRSVTDERFFYEDTLAGLRHAHKLALSSGCAVQFEFDADGFELLQNDQACFNAASSADYSLNVYRPSGEDNYHVTNLPDGVFLGSTTNTLIFNSEGQVTSDGSSVINSTTVTVGDRTILIEGETGFVR